MPGGFHPFHAGHAALYQSAVKAFPNADVYVAATNDTKTRPFPFSIKEKLAKLAGVAPGHFIQVKSPFKSEEITSHYNPNEDVLIFVRSEKDKTEQPKPGGTKKDGSPAYFQPWTGENLQPFSKHAYIAYLPTVEFGPGIKSATEIRNAWPKLDDRRKTAMVMSLYPATQKNPKLAANVVKMLDIGMGGQEGLAEDDAHDIEQRMINKIAKYKEYLAHLKKTDPAAYKREMEKRNAEQSRMPAVSTFEDQGVAEGTNDTIYPNAEVIKSKNGKPVGEIYQDGNSWGAFHYKADRGYDFIDSREEAIEALKDLHQETGRSRPDYTVKGVAEGAPIVIAQAPINVRNPKKAPLPYRNQGDIVPDTKPPSTEKRGVKGRPGQRPMPTYESANLSIEELAQISDKALDDSYHYGRSTPGANFGWMANVQSAKAAKRLIDAGETDIEKISDAIHQGWNVTAAADYKGKLQLDTPTPDEKKLKRAKLAMQSYSQLPEEEKEKDRVVARALLQAIKGDQLDERMVIGCCPNEDTNTNVSESADYLDEK